MIKRIVYFGCSDGKTFENETDARLHEEKIALSQGIRDAVAKVFEKRDHIDIHELVEKLVSNRELFHNAFEQAIAADPISSVAEPKNVINIKDVKAKVVKGNK